MEKRNIVFFIFTITLILVLSNCEAVAELFHGPKPEPILAVYVVGHDVNSEGKRVATVWENGIAVALSDGTNDASAYAIAVSGSDVYIAGEDNGIGTVWKNGVVTGVYTDYSVSLSPARRISVVHSDVYVAGDNYLLKNGISQQLIDDIDRIYTMATDGSNIFLIIRAKPFYGQNNNYVLYRNGSISNIPLRTPYFFSTPATSFTPDAMTIVGSNIYVVGRASGSGYSANFLWKNSDPTSIGNVIDEPVAINVSGSDIYIAGKTSVSKNNIRMSLATGNNLLINGMAVINSDVYVTGTVQNASNRTVAMLWENGVGTALTDGLSNAVANDIVVVKK